MKNIELAQEIQTLLTEKNWTLSVAESCTGGTVSSTLVQVPGASNYFQGGVVSYSEAAKNKNLGVPLKDLEEHGAVSLPVAQQMASGVCERFSTDWGLSTTGFAGPDGGSEKHPVGALCVSVVGPGIEWREEKICDSASRDRSEFIEEATQWALSCLLEQVKLKQ